MSKPTAVRKISGLKWAKPCSHPSFIPHNRPRGQSNRAGLRFEAQVAESLPGAVHGQWFEFEDANGKGWCQVDVLRRVGSLIQVFECKLTWTPVAFYQLRDLYLPVVAKAYGLPAKGIMVCRNLTSKAPPAAHDLVGALTCGLWHRPFIDLAERVNPLALATKSLQRRLGIGAQARL